MVEYLSQVKCRTFYSITVVRFDASTHTTIVVRFDASTCTTIVVRFDDSFLKEFKVGSVKSYHNCGKI